MHDDGLASRPPTARGAGMSEQRLRPEIVLGVVGDASAFGAAQQGSNGAPRPQGASPPRGGPNQANAAPLPAPWDDGDDRARGLQRVSKRRRRSLPMKPRMVSGDGRFDISAHSTMDIGLHNQVCCGNLIHGSGVETGEVLQSAPAALEYIERNWCAQRLPLTGTLCAWPFQNPTSSPYARTLCEPDAQQQRRDVVGITASAMRRLSGPLASLRDEVEALVSERYSLRHAHVLRQHATSCGSSSFSYHRDDEDDEHTALTVIVKLSRGPSAMRVFAAREPFEYDAREGSWAMFNARAFHSSCPATAVCYKVAFFFRSS